MSFLRRCSKRMVVHASHILPRSRRTWSEAMRVEFELIEGEWAALNFAGGCVVAGYKMRLTHLDSIATVLRWAVAIYLSVWSLGILLVGGSIALIKLDPAAQGPGSVQPDVAFSLAYPAWETALLLTMPFLLLLGSVQLMRGSPSAWRLIVPAIAVTTLQAVADIRLPGYLGLSADQPGAIAGFVWTSVALVVPAIWISMRDKGCRASG